MEKTFHYVSCFPLHFFSALAAKEMKGDSEISFTATATSTFIKLVNSAQTSHQPTRAQSEKTLGRLEIIQRTSVIKRREKEYSTIVQIIVKDDRGKAIA